MPPRSVRLKPEIDAALVAEAARLDRPVSWVVVQAVETWLTPSKPRTPVYKEIVTLTGKRPQVVCPSCSWVSADRSARCPEHDMRKLVKA